MKKIKGIVLAVILLLASIMMPFDIYADTITNNNVNINYYLDSVTEMASGTYMQTYRVEFVFDQSYLGWISSKMVGTYINNNTVPVTTAQFTKTQSIYVNGATAETSFSIVTPNTQNGGALQSLSQNIQNSSVTPLADLSTLDDILNVLTDINNNIEIDVLQELQSIVANTSLANDYLELISKYRQWDIPFESFSYVSWFLYKNYEIAEYGNSNSYISGYPAFYIPKYNYVAQSYINQNSQILLIFVSDIQAGLINSYINFNNGNFTSTREYTQIGRGGSGQYLTLFKYTITNNGANANYQPSVQGSAPGNIYFVPILLVTLPYNNYSTDFALRFGLSNSYLDNIQAIANGTNQSNQAASDLESVNDQMADDMIDLATIENGYNQQFNNQLQQIDFSSPLQSNVGILPAANFVITIFNGLINNNPFSVLIIVVCILLIGKKVIGK